VNLLLTRYLRPLRDPIPLAPVLGYFLDNARSATERDGLAQYFRHSLKRFDALERDVRPGDGSWWHDEIDELLRADAAGALVSDRSQGDVASRIAEFAVVARFSVEDDLAAGKRPSLASLDTDNAWSDSAGDEEEDEWTERAQRLAAFCATLSLLIHTDGDDYYGESLLYRELWLEYDPDTAPEIVFANVLLELGRARRAQSGDRSDIGVDWSSFRSVEQLLVDTASRLETGYIRGDADLLHFAGELLSSAASTHDPKLKILLLVSLLERLVVRNPDTQRFNVEESISKQFVLKVGVLAHRSGQFTDLAALRTMLRGMYDRRSAIAHGEHRRSSKPAGIVSQQLVDEEMVSNLYLLGRVVLNCFLDEPEFVRFLKSC
jgi:hypothetical protein